MKKVILLIAGLLILAACQQSSELPPPPRSPQAEAGSVGLATGLFTGYGPAYNVFEGDDAAIFTIGESGGSTSLDFDNFEISAGQADLDVLVEGDLPGGYIWGKGYYWDASSSRWVQYALNGPRASGSDYVIDAADASVRIPRTALSVGSGTNFILLYGCRVEDGYDGWKCGCSATDDAVCNKWMIQHFTVTESAVSGCVEGDVQCSADGTAVEQCDADGNWNVDETCSSGCTEGVCDEPSTGGGCTDNDRRCNSNYDAVEECSNGVWSEVEHCGDSCVDGDTDVSGNTIPAYCISL